MSALKTKTYSSSALIYANRFVKFGSSDTEVTQAAAISDHIIGASGFVGAAAASERIDVHHIGIVDIKLGGSVTRGAWITSDANGKGVAATWQSGAVIYVGGLALASGSDGDIIPVLLQPCFLANESLSVITEVTLTTAQVKALYATPITVLAAPGAGKAHIILGVVAHLDYNSAAYDGIAGGEDLTLKYTDANGTALVKFETTGFLDQTSDQVRYATPTQYGDTNLTPIANAPVVAHMLTGEIATGDSPVKLRIRSLLIDTAW